MEYIKAGSSTINKQSRSIHILIAAIVFGVMFFILNGCQDMDITTAGASTLSLFIATIYLWTSSSGQAGTPIGPPVPLLMGTKDQVVDKCKELLDTLAPGGNYVFSTDKTMMSLSDGTSENMIAACEYMAENGWYK